VQNTTNKTTTTTTAAAATFAKAVDPELYAIITVSLDPDDRSVFLEIGRETPGLASHGPASNGSDYPSLEAAIQSAQRRGVAVTRIHGEGVPEYFYIKSAEFQYHLSRVHPDPDFDPTPW